MATMTSESSISLASSSELFTNTVMTNSIINDNLEEQIQTADTGCVSFSSDFQAQLAQSLSRQSHDDGSDQFEEELIQDLSNADGELDTSNLQEDFVPTSADMEMDSFVCDLQEELVETCTDSEGQLLKSESLREQSVSLDIVLVSQQEHQHEQSPSNGDQNDCMSAEISCITANSYVEDLGTVDELVVDQLQELVVEDNLQEFVAVRSKSCDELTRRAVVLDQLQSGIIRKSKSYDEITSIVVQDQDHLQHSSFEQLQELVEDGELVIRGHLQELEVEQKKVEAPTFTTNDSKCHVYANRFSCEEKEMQTEQAHDLNNSDSCGVDSLDRFIVQSKPRSKSCDEITKRDSQAMNCEQDMSNDNNVRPWSSQSDLNTFSYKGINEINIQENIASSVIKEAKEWNSVNQPDSFSESTLQKQKPTKRRLKKEKKQGYVRRFSLNHLLERQSPPQNILDNSIPDLACTDSVSEMSSGTLDTSQMPSHADNTKGCTDSAPELFAHNTHSSQLPPHTDNAKGCIGYTCVSETSKLRVRNKTRPVTVEVTAKESNKISHKRSRGRPKKAKKGKIRKIKETMLEKICEDKVPEDYNEILVEHKLEQEDDDWLTGNFCGKEIISPYRKKLKLNMREDLVASREKPDWSIKITKPTKAVRKRSGGTIPCIEIDDYMD